MMINSRSFLFQWLSRWHCGERIAHYHS